MSECNCNARQKHRSEKEYKSLINRLNRIEGQVRGIKNMLENDSYCTDILVQVSAVTSALNAFNKELLGQHIKTCVTEGIKNGDNEVIEDLTQAIKKLMK